MMGRKMLDLSGTSRRTVTLPKSLDDEMASTNSVNWSEVARLAFSATLGSIRDEKMAEEKRQKEHAARLAVIESGSGY